MIKLQGKTEEIHTSNRIVFDPRSGFSRGRSSAPTLEFPLIYGHKCPVCGNVMQALFRAPKTFSLWPYEETVILSQGEKNSGEILKVVPNESTRRDKSCYRMEFNPSEGGSVKITLRNHIMRYRVIDERQCTGDGFWEEGFEKPCTKAGIFSLRGDLLVKDWLLFSHMLEAELQAFNIPSIKELILPGDTDFRLVPSVGTAPPVILVERQNLIYGFHYRTRPKLAPFRKLGK